MNNQQCTNSLKCIHEQTDDPIEFEEQPSEIKLNVAHCFFEICFLVNDFYGVLEKHTENKNIEPFERERKSGN